MLNAARHLPGADDATCLIASLLERHTGQQLAPSRGWRIETMLSPLLRERGFADFDSLVRALRTARDPSLAEAVVDALLNRETSFFRDAGVLEQVADAAIAMQAEQSRPVRIWSAGCSTGQEAVSLAMLFAERAGGMTVPEIQATDISITALSRARSATYTQFEVQRGLPIRRLIQWFDPAGQDWIVKPELRNRVRYHRHNLAGDPPLASRHDIILCRNVLLYFPSATRGRVLDMLAGALRPGGLIVLGAGETVIGHSDRLQPSTAWRGLYTTTQSN